MSDTIFALATAKGRAGIAVLRLSGPLALAMAETLAGAGLPASGRSLRRIRDAEGQVLDGHVPGRQRRLGADVGLGQAPRLGSRWR